MGSRVAAIFDMDGVIVNTVASLYNIYTEILNGFAASWSRAEFNRLNGCNLDQIVSLLAEEHGLRGHEDELRNCFETRFTGLYTEVDLVAGIVPVLEILKNHAVTTCVASASSRRNIDAVMRRFNLSRFFDFIVSGDEVARAKPDPQIYDLARARCQCKEHFVIEDSLNGIDGAQRAGLVAIFHNPAGEPNTRGASYNIAGLSDIPKIILEDKAIIVSKAMHIEIRREDLRHSFSTGEQHLADEIWSRALKENASLFNDDVATYRCHTMLPNRELVISCSRAEYKHVFAGLRDRGLRLVTPIGVSGVVIDKNGKFLLGKRSENVSEYAGYYEFVPSGGITTRNTTGTLYLEQMKAELSEETGIDPQMIRSMTPFCLVYDRIDGVFDIGVKLLLSCDIDPEALRSNEYAAFVLLDTDSLERLIRHEPVAPTSEAMFRAMLDDSGEAR